MKSGEVFTRWTEAPLNFRPTYKYDIGSDSYDTSRKRRAPSWTDRILYMDRGMECLEYDCDNTVRTSDHRPVYATFVADVEAAASSSSGEAKESSFSHLGDDKEHSPLDSEEKLSSSSRSRGADTRSRQSSFGPSAGPLKPSLSNGDFKGECMQPLDEGDEGLEEGKIPEFSSESQVCVIM